MTHNDTTTLTKSSLTGAHRLVLICAPSHDDLTEYTSKLVENLPDLGPPAVLRKIESPLTYDQLLSQLALDREATEVALVFCGHGDPSALLGPAKHPGAPGYSETLAPFYDETHLPLGPGHMLAFCCSAAAGLGASFEREAPGGTFIGFKDDIPFLTEGGSYAECYRGIIHGLASALLNVSDRGRLEHVADNIYEQALASFPPEKDGTVHDWGLMMRGGLLQQWADLKVIVR
jgi:hypothetical protein